MNWLSAAVGALIGVLVGLAVFWVLSVLFHFLVTAPDELISGLRKDLYGLKSQNSYLRKALGDRRRNQDAVDNLARLRQAGVQIYAVHQPQDLEEWRASHQAWKQEVLAALKDHFTAATWSQFESLGRIVKRPYEHESNEEHRHYLAILETELGILERIIRTHDMLHEVNQAYLDAGMEDSLDEN